MTPEEKDAARRERNRIRQRAYRQTEAGKAVMRRWNQSAAGKDATAKYESRPDIKAKDKERRQSPEYKATYLAYRQSEHGRSVRAKWHKSEKWRKWYSAYRAERRKRNGSNSANTSALGEIFTTQLMSDDLYAAIHAIVPRWYPRDVRDDIIMEIIVAVLEGRESVTSASRKVGSFAPAHYKENFKSVSLDAVIPGTDNLRLIDTLSACL